MRSTGIARITTERAGRRRRRHSSSAVRELERPPRIPSVLPPLRPSRRAADRRGLHARSGTPEARSGRPIASPAGRAFGLRDGGRARLIWTTGEPGEPVRACRRAPAISAQSIGSSGRAATRSRLCRDVMGPRPWSAIARSSVTRPGGDSLVVPERAVPGSRQGARARRRRERASRARGRPTASTRAGRVALGLVGPSVRRRSRASRVRVVREIVCGPP